MKRNFKLKRKKNLIILICILLLILASVYSQQRSQTIPSPSPVADVLTEEEKFILNPPSKESSMSALKKHAQMVAELAKESKSLEIQKDCKPNPRVLQVKLGSEIKISNKDGVNRRIIVDSKNFFDIPANGSKMLKADFKYGTGDYGYVCEGVGIVGFLRVV